MQFLSNCHKGCQYLRSVTNFISFITSCFSLPKSVSLGKGKSDEKYPQKLKMMEREEKEFRKKFKVSFLHVKYKN